MPNCRVELFHEVEDAQPLSLAVGIFDGVHVGHQAVVETAIEAAKSHGGLCGVLTFDPHPSRILRPDQATELIMTHEQKSEALRLMGVDLVVWKTFDTSIAGVSAEGFLSYLKQGLLSLHSVHVGENFRFGKGRVGDVDLLKKSGREVGVSVVGCPRLHQGNTIVSSSRIRDCLRNGEVEDANVMFGRFYETWGTVIQGKRLGRELGFPTLNMRWNPELRPRYGVYVVKVGLSGSPERAWGIANYGVRPSVETDVEPQLEVHMLQRCTWDKGDQLVVDWLTFVRSEQKFNSLDELKEQINRDVIFAAAYAGRH